MKRRLFVKKTSLLTSALLFLSTEALLSTPKPDNINNLDLTPMLGTSKKIIIKGTILDSITHLPINTDMHIKTKRNRFFSKKHSINALNGSYSIYSGFSNSEKISEKLLIEIKVDGYKPYEGNLYLTRNGCSVHSDQWQYNPDFKPEYCPVNYEESNLLFSTFNFYLVKNPGFN
ncbi:hypothetical protein OIU83_22370 [Flavobacterium sp. LS1R49]|uniref:Carboxypeptidase regulatory-like domain-containing protein n=1 Tax=Flavobacterium shii TaxID=2987687 RepID=A0A9X2ZKN5_9FLAO|nr:hypothetical protein [Flavobacterium shii]MCV9930422.1 hypothetical protein [Flavobacterium shii]